MYENCSYSYFTLSTPYDVVPGFQASLCSKSKNSQTNSIPFFYAAPRTHDDDGFETRGGECFVKTTPH